MRLERDFDGQEMRIPGEFKLYAINMNYLSVTGSSEIQLGEALNIKLSIKGFLSQWEIFLEGKVIRAFETENGINYGIHIKATTELRYFLKEYVSSFSTARLRDSLVLSSLSEKRHSIHDGVEIYSTLQEFYESFLANKEELDQQSALTELIKVMGVEEGNIYLINTATQKLDNIVSTRGEKRPNCDFRDSFLGKAYATYETVNFRGTIDNQAVSYLIMPFVNSHQKTIGVVELRNKSHQQSFDYRDERALRLITYLLSMLYYDYDPTSGNTEIDEFNQYLPQYHLYPGTTASSQKINKLMKKMALSPHHILLQGERGTGKMTTAKRMIKKSIQGHLSQEIVDFDKDLPQDLNRVEWDQPGSLILLNIPRLDRRSQKILFEKIRYGKKRIFTISHEDLDELAQKNLLYQPLFELISTVRFNIPPLRHRKSELIAVAQQVLQQECHRRGDPIERALSPNTLTAIESYSWPGNMTELEKLTRKALLTQPHAPMITLDIPVGEDAERSEDLSKLAQKLHQKADLCLSADRHLKILTKLLQSREKAS